MWGQDHQWLDMELLKLGLEASQAGTSPSTSVALPHGLETPRGIQGGRKEKGRL